MPLADMLPYRGSAETADTQNAFDQETERAKAARDDLLLQLNIETATWGLDLWETAYGLEHDAEKSYDFRRSRIESKKRSQGVTTKEMIQNVAQSFSNGVVEVIEHPALYSFDVKFVGTLGIPPNMDDLTAAIEEIKPAHLAYVYVYVYIIWDSVERYNHTWDEWDSKILSWDQFETYKE